MDEKVKKNRKYIDIMVRATTLGLMDTEELTDRWMDIESADLKFDMRLDDWIVSDDIDFAHDFLGIRDNIVRDEFPSKDFGFFIPRFAKVGWSGSPAENQENLKHEKYIF